MTNSADEHRLRDLALLRGVRDRIDREYAQPLDVEALARGVNMSAGHLSRQFREAYGEPPYSYLMTRRIERAMALLRTGDLSVTDVCFAVGCSSLGTFSTRFTELVGAVAEPLPRGSGSGHGGHASLRRQEGDPAGPAAGRRSWLTSTDARSSSREPTPASARRPRACWQVAGPASCWRVARRRGPADRDEGDRGRAPATTISTTSQLDLADLASVRTAAETFLASGEPLHVLINNAGLAGSRGMTTSGFEIAFGTNHVGTFLFTELLRDHIVASGPGRIVNVASTAHYRPKGIDWDAIRRTTVTRTGFDEYSRVQAGQRAARAGARADSSRGRV